MEDRRLISWPMFADCFFPNIYSVIHVPCFFFIVRLRYRIVHILSDLSPHMVICELKLVDEIDGHMI